MEDIKLNNKGVTLIEVLIACILISLCMAGSSATLLYTNKTNIISHHQLQAVNFAKDTLEEQLLKVYDDPTLDPSLAKNPYIVALPACDLKDKFSATRTYKVDTITEGKKITVTVAWTEEGQTKQESLYGLVIIP